MLILFNRNREFNFYKNDFIHKITLNALMYQSIGRIDVVSRPITVSSRLRAASSRNSFAIYLGLGAEGFGLGLGLGLDLGLRLDSLVHISRPVDRKLRPTS